MKENFTSFAIILNLNMELNFFSTCSAPSLSIFYANYCRTKNDRMVVVPVKSISKLTAFKSTSSCLIGLVVTDNSGSQDSKKDLDLHKIT